MTRLLALLFRLRNAAFRCIDWLANAPAGQIVVWLLVPLLALLGIMCLRAFAPGGR